jgi:hypothetical protein
MVLERMSVGLDAHARSLLDGELLDQRRLADACLTPTRTSRPRPGPSLRVPTAEGLERRFSLEDTSAAAIGRQAAAATPRTGTGTSPASASATVAASPIAVRTRIGVTVWSRMRSPQRHGS